MDKLYTVNEVSNILKVSSDTIRRWERKGLIKSKRSNINYRLFDIEEIKRINNRIKRNSTFNNFTILKSNKKTKYNIIELFAGAGGTALGMENAGLNHTLLVENDKNAVSTIKKNRPLWNIIQSDVRDINYKGIKADIVQGGFPCQAFSYAGKKLGFEDVRGTLFYELARCIKEVKPKIVIGENVKGLEKHDDGKTLQTIINVFKEIGYRVSYKVLRSQYLDVPQKRERLIIIGIRNDLDIPFLFPKEKDYIISLKEALMNCPESLGQTYSKQKEKILSKIPEGGYWKDLPINLQKEYMGSSYHMSGGKTGMARRLSWNEPSLTLTCSPAQKQTERCHPEETRPLTIREYARIQTFPDNWEFVGSVSSQYKQIGNALPVNVAYYLGLCTIAMLENKPDLNIMEMWDEFKEDNFLNTQLAFDI